MRVHYRPDKLVETTDGNAFVREGDEKRKLTETEKREIRLNKGELDVELESSPLKFPNEFDTQLMAIYRDVFLEKRQLSQQRFGLEDLLHMSKLGTFEKGKFKPNLACTIIFAKESRSVLPGAFIRVLRYDGVEEKFGAKLNSVADKLFDGPLPLQITAAERYIESQIRNFTRLGRDGLGAGHECRLPDP
jgi:ATP-dependent DNA helicase RecG